MLLATGGSDAGATIMGFAIWALIIIAYWAPTLTAWTRHVPNLAQVAIVNLFLGWTFIGWVIALVMAVKPVPSATEARELWRVAKPVPQPRSLTSCSPGQGAHFGPVQLYTLACRWERLTARAEVSQ